MNSNTTTQAQQFAAAYAADMARQMLRTIRWVRWAATAIMLVAMVTSYSHQAGYLAGIGTPVLGAWLIPGAVDALTFLCVKVLGTPGMAQPAKKMALRVLVFPVLASGGINFVAPGELVTKLVFVLAVLMIPAAELVASRIKPDFAAMDLMEREVATEAVPVVDQALAASRSEAARKAAAKRRENADTAKAAVAAKSAARKARAAERAARTPVEQIEALEDVAPVSPAPATVSWERVAQMLDRAQTA